MNKLWLNHKIDILTLIVLFLGISVWILNGRLSVGEIDLTDSILSCEKKRFGSYSVNFSKNSTDYSMTKKYNFCEEYKGEIEGKSVIGKYLKRNKLLINLDVNGYSYHRDTALLAFISVFLLTLLSWLLLRTPIKWLEQKMHNKPLN